MITQSQKVKWLDALRSGEYSQTTRRLYRDETDAYCCLGVLAVCVGKTKDEINLRSMLSQVNLGWLLHEQENDVWECKLANMNDDAGMNFEQIADWIEANVPAELDEGVLVKREAVGE